MIAAIKRAGFNAVEWRAEGSPHAVKAAQPADVNSKEADYLDENDNPQVSFLEWRFGKL